MKKHNATQLKKMAWNAFSEYIRKRDCLKTTGTLEQGVCVSCGRRHLYSELQAGHFIQGRHNSVLFNEKNCHAQCVGCNIFKRGNLVEYFVYMENTYGQGVINELRHKDRELRQFKTYELEDMIKEFKIKTKQLEERYNEGNIN